MAEVSEELRIPVWIRLYIVYLWIVLIKIHHVRDLDLLLVHVMFVFSWGRTSVMYLFVCLSARFVLLHRQRFFFVVSCTFYQELNGLSFLLNWQDVCKERCECGTEILVLSEELI